MLTIIGDCAKMSEDLMIAGEWRAAIQVAAVVVGGLLLLIPAWYLGIPLLMTDPRGASRLRRRVRPRR